MSVLKALFFGTVSAAATASALAAPGAPWDSLYEGNELVLSQELTLTPEISYAPGVRLRLEAREPLPLPDGGLMYYELRESPCAHPAWQAEEVVVPEGSEPQNGVAVSVQRCVWGVYVEARDLGRASLFVPAGLVGR